MLFKTNLLCFSTSVSNFRSPSPSVLTSFQLKLRAFCAVKEVISWASAGGAVLEIDQWQICDCIFKQPQNDEILSVGWECVPAYTQVLAHTPAGTENTLTAMFLLMGGTISFSIPICYAFTSLLVPETFFSLRLWKSQDRGWGLPSVSRQGQRWEHVGLFQTSVSAEGHAVTVGFRLSQCSLSDFLWSLCISSLMSTTVQIPETSLDFQNHIIQSPSMEPSERGRRKGRFLQNLWSVSISRKTCSKNEQ